MGAKESRPENSTLSTPVVSTTTESTKPLDEQKKSIQPAKPRLFKSSEVAKHSSKSDCWVIVKGKVYNVTEFLSVHPGGAGVILAQAGEDATDEFVSSHPPTTFTLLAKWYIGDVEGGNKLLRP
mmetsp:Transcript_26554/g.43481  ORF Transcript_26554/g.43481 Transcript_26554/m.43481 type:complete len:124 (+) Transcript_26554:218-589(+)